MSSKLARLLLAGSACALAAPQVFAQDRLETIIVTTPGPDRSADELIGNASALDREDIIERLAASLGDTLDSEPGVASTFFGAGASRPILRGLGAERVQVLTNGIGVIDVSAASPDHQVAADGIDADRIEILRGPAALAYGGQAIGGVVNVIDGLIAEELPEKQFSGDLFGAYNSVNEGDELAGRGQFTTGRLVFTVSATSRDFSDYDIPDFAESAALRALEEAEAGPGGGEEEEEEARGTLPNSFVETQSLAAGLSYVADQGFFGIAYREQTAEYGLPGHGHEHEEEAGMGGMEEEEEEENPFIDLEHQRIDIRGGWNFQDSFLTDISGSLAIVDYEHTEFEAPGEAGTVYETDGVEGRVELGHAWNGFAGAAGLQFIDKELSAEGEEAFLTETTTNSIGLFIFETREFESGFGIEGGLRFDDIEMDNVDQGTRDFSLVSGSAGIHKHLPAGWFVGGQVAYTQRAPAETELFAFGPHLATEQFEVGDANLDEETGLNFEGTVRWSNDIANFGVNVFVTSFSDFIYLTPGEAVIDGVLTDEGDELPVFLYVQEDAEFVGGEIYGGLSFDDGPLGADWDFEAGIDVVGTELDSGGHVPFIPPLTLNGAASAEWGAWEIGAAITSADNQSDPGVGQLETDGYTVIDLRGEVDLSDFNIGDAIKLNKNPAKVEVVLQQSSRVVRAFKRPEQNEGTM
ncbi:MAG: TonB-dependent receptor, partial [Pseudomonadota bacterium]